MKAKEISRHILYLPVTNGKSEQSIKEGASLIEAHTIEFMEWSFGAEGLDGKTKDNLTSDIKELYQSFIKFKEEQK